MAAPLQEVDPEAAMATKANPPLRDQIERALGELETLSDEIRVRIHLAGMDARDTWSKDLEPRLESAREHAKEAKAASKKVLEDTVAAFKSFSETLRT
jgi:hypothetical protein